MASVYFPSISKSSLAITKEADSKREERPILTFPPIRVGRVEEAAASALSSLAHPPRSIPISSDLAISRIEMEAAKIRLQRIFSSVKKEAKEKIFFSEVYTPSSSLYPFSVVIRSGSSQLLLGKDTYLFGIDFLKDDEAEELKTRKEFDLLDRVNRELLSATHNPKGIAAIVTMGSRRRDWGDRAKIPGIEWGDFRVPDFFDSKEKAERTIAILFEKTSSLEKKTFDCVVLEVPGFFPFPEKVYRIKKDSLDRRVPVEKWFERPFKLINEALLSSKACFVHCSKGVSRSPMVVAAYLMLHFSLTKKEALNLIEKNRPFINLNPLWDSLLDEFERAMQEQKHFDLIDF